MLTVRQMFNEHSALNSPKKGGRKEGCTEMSLLSIPFFCLFPFQGLACSIASGLSLMRCNVVVHVTFQELFVNKMYVRTTAELL